MAPLLGRYIHPNHRRLRRPQPSLCSARRCREEPACFVGFRRVLVVIRLGGWPIQSWHTTVTGSGDVLATISPARHP
jgi:hypothetical protein